MKPAAAHGTPRQGPGRAKPDRLSDEQFQETLQKLAARRFHLSEDNQDYLKGILKGILDDVSRGPANLDFAIVNVETALQSYAVLDHVYSNLARPSAIAAEATGLLSATHGLLAVLRKLHAVTVHQVTEVRDERLLADPVAGFQTPTRQTADGWRLLPISCRGLRRARLRWQPTTSPPSAAAGPRTTRCRRWFEACAASSTSSTLAKPRNPQSEWILVVSILFWLHLRLAASPTPSQMSDLLVTTSQSRVTIKHP